MTLLRQAVGRLKWASSHRPPLTILLSALVVALGLICAALGSHLAPDDPAAEDLNAGLQGPSGLHLLGTDESGRDILSRIIVGARLAVLGPAGVVILAAVIGATLGLIAGYRGGIVDAVIMRGADLLCSLPALLVAVVLVGILGGGYLATTGILVLLTLSIDTRVVRGATLEQRGLPYVSAAITLGLPRRRIVFRHILPNVSGLIVANLFLNFAQVLVVLAALSFLGLGIPPGAPDWGRMLSENLSLVQTQPAASIGPGAALIVFAVAMNLLGDWTYENVSDRGRG